MKRFRNILYVAEALKGPSSAFDRALALAEENQARLTVAAVHEPHIAAVRLPDNRTFLDIEIWVREEQAQCWDAFDARAGDRIELEKTLLSGTHFLEVIRDVQRNGRDLVIKPVEAGDWRQRLLGSADRHLLRKCPVPVWLIRAETEASRRILAAIDFDVEGQSPATGQLTQDILELSLSLAVAELAELYVVHVWDAPAEGMLRRWSSEPGEVNGYVERERSWHLNAATQAMDQLAASVGQEAVDFVKPHLRLPKGSAREVIPALAGELGVDLIVMGTVGRTGVPGLIIGNTAESVLDRIECSILALKPPGFSSPVA